VEEPVRRDSPNDRLSCGLKWTEDVRHDGAGLDGVHRATAVPDASSASGRSGTGNPLERIANAGHIGVVGGGIRRMSVEGGA